MKFSVVMIDTLMNVFICEKAMVKCSCPFHFSKCNSLFTKTFMVELHNIEIESVIFFCGLLSNKDNNVFIFEKNFLLLLYRFGFISANIINFIRSN